MIGLNLIFTVYVVVTTVFALYQARLMRKQTELLKSQCGNNRAYDDLRTEFTKLRVAYGNLLNEYNKTKGDGAKENVENETPRSEVKDNRPKSRRRKPRQETK